MKYTKNAGLKLRNLGFEFAYDHQPTPEADCHYEVFRKGALEVTVDHTDQDIIVDITVDCQKINIVSTAQLMQLDKIINNTKIN